MKSKNHNSLSKILEISSKTREIGVFTPQIINDVKNRDKNGQTELTKEFDRILAVGSSEEKDNIKTFIGKKLQTLLKEKPTQEILLGELTNSRILTVKKVNLSMIENKTSSQYPNGKYVNSFSEKDLGSYRVIMQNKKSIVLLPKDLVAKTCAISKAIKDNDLEKNRF